VDLGGAASVIKLWDQTLYFRLDRHPSSCRPFPFVSNRLVDEDIALLLEELKQGLVQVQVHVYNSGVERKTAAMQHRLSSEWPIFCSQSEELTPLLFDKLVGHVPLPLGAFVILQAIASETER